MIRKLAAAVVVAGIAGTAGACSSYSPATTAGPSLTAIAEHQVTAHGGRVDTYLTVGDGTGYAAGSKPGTLTTVKCYAGDLKAATAQADLNPQNHPVYGTDNGVAWGCAAI